MRRDELYGSARWARAEEIAAAGLHDPKGLYFGQSAAGKPLHLPSDMPLITFGGAGSGQGRDVILHNVLTHPGHMFITDPKGELAAVATQGQGTRGKAAYCINPGQAPEQIAYSTRSGRCVRNGGLREGSNRCESWPELVGWLGAGKEHTGRIPASKTLVVSGSREELTKEAQKRNPCLVSNTKHGQF